MRSLEDACKSNTCKAVDIKLIETIKALKLNINAAWTWFKSRHFEETSQRSGRQPRVGRLGPCDRLHEQS